MQAAKDQLKEAENLKKLLNKERKQQYQEKALLQAVNSKLQNHGEYEAIFGKERDRNEELQKKLLKIAKKHPGDLNEAKLQELKGKYPDYPTRFAKALEDVSGKMSDAFKNPRRIFRRQKSQEALLAQNETFIDSLEAIVYMVNSVVDKGNKSDIFNQAIEKLKNFPIPKENGEEENKVIIENILKNADKEFLQQLNGENTGLPPLYKPIADKILNKQQKKNQGHQADLLNLDS